MITIIHAIKTTTIVLISVAKFESTFSIPILANIDVNDANIAESRAKINHIFKSFFSTLSIILDNRSMISNYKIITLCGSTRFKDQFLEMQKKLTLEGNIVISVGLFGHSGDKEVLNDGVKEMLDDMHKRKIDLADEIYVINVGGYIGSSTKSEIEYAIKTGKKVNYLENE